MEDLYDLAENMLHHLPAKPKRVFSDKLAKWKIGEGKYSTQQRIMDAGVWHSVVFTCIGIPVPPLPGRTGPSLKSIYRVSYADTGSQLFLRTARGPSKQMHLRTIGNYKWPKMLVNCIIYNGGVNHQSRTVWFLYSCAYTLPIEYTNPVRGSLLPLHLRTWIIHAPLLQRAIDGPARQCCQLLTVNSS